MLPKDPMILLSYMNTQLRDFYTGLDALADGLGIDVESVQETLRGIGYEYDENANQFV